MVPFNLFHCNLSSSTVHDYEVSDSIGPNSELYNKVSRKFVFSEMQNLSFEN